MGNASSILDALEMCKLAYEFNPKVYRKKAKNPFSRGVGHLVAGGDLGFISVVCIASLFSGTRFYYSAERWSVYGAQGVESFEIKSKEMCDYYSRVAQAWSLMEGNKWYSSRLKNIVNYVDEPIEQFVSINNGEDEDGFAGEPIIFPSWEYHPDKTFHRIFIEWHGCRESSLETFYHFYEFAVRIRECLPKVKALISAYKRSMKKKSIKGVGINEQRNHIKDNSDIDKCA